MAGVEEKRRSTSRRKLVAELAVRRTELEMQNVELREAQSRLELSRARTFSLFDLSPVPYLVIRDDLNVTEANMAAAELTGLERSRLVGASIDVLAVESERHRWQTTLASFFGQSRCTPFDSVLRTSGGEHRHVHFVCQPLDSEIAGSGKLLLVALIDVTARVEAERERQQLSQKLLETQKLESLGVLAGGIAHDFNNLLTGILTAAWLLRDEVKEQPSAFSLAEQIESAGQRAADLCKQLLSYAGKGRVSMNPLRLNPLVTDVLALLSASLPKRHRLLLQPATCLPPVIGDASQLRQIVLNLVVNASEAIADREGEVYIRTGIETINPRTLSGLVTGMDRPGGEHVFFEVEDTGCGMGAETMARIFEPFFTTKLTGRGLGLAAVVGIVRDHHGILSVRSQVGKGSCFRLWLPVSDAATPASEARTPPPLCRPTKAATIMVVDDEPIVRRVMSRVLSQLGCQVVLAESGQEAVDTLACLRSPPDALLLDATMSGWDGPETFVALRECGYQGPVFFMSGYAADEIAKRLSHLEVAGFLQKPIATRELIEKVGALLPPGVSMDGRGRLQPS